MSLRMIVLVVLLFVTGDLMAQTLGACGQYRTLITRSAYRTFGPEAPIATLVAQMHQESACRADAKSWAGAQGLTQFMPATAADMARLHPEVCAPANPFSPRWAIECRDRYMRSLLKLADGATESDDMGMALASYNGGYGWLRRDQAMCRIAPPTLFPCAPCDPQRWWGNVELTPDRKRRPSAIKENRDYPKRIMCEIAPRYVAEGWGRAVECPE